MKPSLDGIAVAGGASVGGSTGLPAVTDALRPGPVEYTLPVGEGDGVCIKEVVNDV